MDGVLHASIGITEGDLDRRLDGPNGDQEALPYPLPDAVANGN